MINSQAIEDAKPVKAAIRRLIRELQTDPNAIAILEQHEGGLSVDVTNGQHHPVFVGPELAESVLIRLRLMADIDAFHPGLVHGQCPLKLKSGPEVLSVRSNRTPEDDVVAVTLGILGTEPVQ